MNTDEYLRDAIASDRDANNVGWFVILPSTFTCSPRDMHESAQEVMTYVTKHGQPNLIITFMCDSSS